MINFLSDHILFFLVSRWEKAGEVSREVWEKVGGHGLLGVVIPEEHGGVGGDYFHAVVALEEQWVGLKI